MIVSSHYSLQISELLYYSMHFVSSVVKWYQCCIQSYHCYCSTTILLLIVNWASLVAQLVQNPPAMQETGFDPWVGKSPWRREQIPIPVF